jgi:hypothetical protein
LVGTGFVVVAVVAGLALSGVPAQAAEWEPYVENCQQYGPSDPSSCDSFGKLTKRTTPTDPVPHVVRSQFESYGEGVTVHNGWSGSSKWHLYIPDQVDPSGTLYGFGDCIEWGRSTTDCRKVGGYDIPEGKRVTLEVCVYNAGWICTRSWGVS